MKENLWYYPVSNPPYHLARRIMPPICRIKLRYLQMHMSSFDVKIHDMTPKPVSDRMFSLLELYDMHTGFFSKVLDGISDTDSHKRLDTKANHIAWLTGTLVEQRAEMANWLGTEYHQQAHELFKDNQGIKEDVTYPSLDNFKRDWNVVSPLCREAFVKVTDEKLDSNFEMPGMTFPYFQMVLFMLYREANIIGQIALWRRLLGYDAMKYM